MHLAVAGVGSLHRGGRPVPLPELTVDGPGIVLVRGANGSGKSTLLELLAGGIRPLHGSVSVCGVPAHSSAARRLRRVSRTDIALLPHVTLRRHAMLFAHAAGVQPAAALESLVDEGLGPRIDARVATLSTGEARRAWVRLTTLGAAPVLLLDEPFLGLDAAAGETLQARLERWGSNRLVLLVDHGDRRLRGVVRELRMGPGAA
ncbi:ATP-binding cassette domain-containing protein [Agrococcus sp. ProA11]|uniref:ABC transporter ATP-binding protein n=1 Tax=Agrococcus chionoecetis TaxID=3153752 RepID=UPI003261CD01